MPKIKQLETQIRLTGHINKAQAKLKKKKKTEGGRSWRRRRRHKGLCLAAWRLSRRAAWPAWPALWCWQPSNNNNSNYNRNLSKKKQLQNWLENLWQWAWPGARGETSRRVTRAAHCLANAHSSSSTSRRSKSSSRRSRSSIS